MSRGGGPRWQRPAAALAAASLLHALGPSARATGLGCSAGPLAALHPGALRLRGGREPVAPSERDSSLATVSEITGMVSTIFLSSSGGADDDMVLPQALPVSDIASQSLERDYQVA